MQYEKVYVDMEKSVFDWKEWDGDAGESMVFMDCTFKRDFGPWKNGEHADTISVDYQQGKMQQHDDQGKLLHECEIRLEPA